jgi:hypothetical protein
VGWIALRLAPLVVDARLGDGQGAGDPQAGQAAQLARVELCEQAIGIGTRASLEPGTELARS